jgi:hypothetical protein
MYVMNENMNSMYDVLYSSEFLNEADLAESFSPIRKTTIVVAIVVVANVVVANVVVTNVVVADVVVANVVVANVVVKMSSSPMSSSPMSSSPMSSSPRCRRPNSVPAQDPLLRRQQRVRRPDAELPLLRRETPTILVHLPIPQLIFIRVFILLFAFVGFFDMENLKK